MLTNTCKTFAARIDGYGRGAGCGVLVLKRLAGAQRDDDNILAVSRGSAINQDRRAAHLLSPLSSMTVAALIDKH